MQYQEFIPIRVDEHILEDHIASDTSFLVITQEILCFENGVYIKSRFKTEVINLLAEVLHVRSWRDEEHAIKGHSIVFIELRAGMIKLRRP